MNTEPTKYLSLLRPEATKNILKLLTKPMSINLVGKKDNGQKRLFEDIVKLKTEQTRAYYVNMKSYAENYSGLMRELSHQVFNNGHVFNRISDLFKTNSTQCILFIDNYDALLNNKDIDSKYDVQFIDDLNYIKNNNKVSLVCVSEYTHNTQPIFINKKAHRNSWLDLENQTLDKLTYKEIEAELFNQLNPEYDQWLEANKHIKQELIEIIHKLDGGNYNFLCHLTKEINTQNSDDDRLEFNKRLKLWMKEYKKQNKKGFGKRVYDGKRAMDEFMIILGSPKFSIADFITNIISKLKGK